MYHVSTCMVAIIIQFINYAQSNCENDPTLCGICGVCRKSNQQGKANDYYCDTTFTKGIFSANPPNCTYVDKCKRMKCLNRGTCISKMDQYNCHCAPGFYGYKCQNKVNMKRGNDNKNCILQVCF